MKDINWIHPFKSRVRTALSFALVSAVLAPLALLTATDGNGETESKTAKPAAQKSAVDSSKTTPKAAPTKLTGAELYSIDRKSTRLNSSHLGISYAVFCLKK